MCVNSISSNINLSIKSFEDSIIGEDLAEQWNISAIFPRRSQGESEGNGGVMPQSRGSRYDWQSFVHILDLDESLEKVAKKLANGLTKFTRNKELSGMANADSYIFRSVISNDIQPLSFYLLDEDVLMLMNQIHGEKPLNEVLENEEILEQFWGSVDNAKEVMAHVDEDEWADMM